MAEIKNFKVKAEAHDIIIKIPEVDSIIIGNDHFDDKGFNKAIKKLMVNSKYGMFQIPLDDVNSIEFNIEDDDGNCVHVDSSRIFAEVKNAEIQ